MKLIPYGKQSINTSDMKAVYKALKSDFISGGKYVTNLEKNFKKYFKSKYTIACSSGTSALHLALSSIDIKKNDVIIMPAVNFIAVYNLSKLMNAKIFLADIDAHSGQMTPKTLIECIKKNKIKKIKAIVTMSLGGYPINITDFYDIKKRYRCYLIEDSCHSLGARYKYNNKYISIGSCKHSDISTFSLHPVKTITSGEGGIASTNNKKLFKKMMLFRAHGIEKNHKFHWKYNVSNVGLNYRISDINCALAISQLKKINRLIFNRNKIYNNYIKFFKNYKDITSIPKCDNKPSFHLFIININFDKLKTNKDHFLNYLKKNKILSQFHYTPIYKFKICKGLKKDFYGSEQYYKNGLSLPIFSDYTNKEQNMVLNKIKNYFDKYKKLNKDKKLNILKNKILILGGSGLLGQNLIKRFKNEGINNIFSVSKNNSKFKTDLTKYQDAKIAFNKINPEIVINAAGLTSLEECEKNPKKCYQINTGIVKNILKIKSQQNFKFIQISTDQVYGPNRNILNKENSKIKIVNNYAKSKYIAEKLCLKDKEILNIRTNFSGISNRKVKTFFEWAQESIKKKKKLLLFEDMYCSTIDVQSLSNIIVNLVRCDAKGLFNIGASNAISKKDFILKLANKLSKKNKTINYISDSIDLIYPKRNKNLGLDTKKVTKHFKIKMPSSNQAIQNMINDN